MRTLIATMQAAAQASDASARFCAKSGWRSRWPCPSFKHHSSRGQRKDRVGGEVRIEPHGEVPEAPLPQGGSRPPSLGVPRGPQVGLERHFLEHMADICPFVQILDAPVPQTVDNVTDALRILDLPMAEQVIEVPRISCSPCPSRFPIPEPQPAEQLVEVPTVLSPLRIAEQIVGIPVPRGHGKRRVQGSLPRQSSTATPSSVERISERMVEQIVDISSGGGLGQGLASSAGAADEDFAGGVSHFSPRKKVWSTGQVVSAQLGGHVNSSTLSAHQLARAGEHVDYDGSDEWVLICPSRHRRVLELEQTYQLDRLGPAGGCRGRLGRGAAGKRRCIVLEPGHFWNRRTHQTIWKPLEGIKVVWVGTRNAEGEVYYWYRGTRVSTLDLPPLPPG